MIIALSELRNTPQEDYKIIGALGFTNLSARKWKLILSSVSINDLINMSQEDAYNLICNIKGLGQSAAQTFIDEYPFYMEDIDYIINNMIIINSVNIAPLTGKQIRFTGCRDKALEDKLRMMGYDADGSGSVTKQTDILLIPYDGFTSTKTSKVSPDCIVVPISEFTENMKKYI